jgi:hypothetical protein
MMSAVKSVNKRVFTHGEKWITKVVVVVVVVVKTQVFSNSKEV